jgi:phosphatidylglycerol:prolipoprotein diacylglycerol transferase
LTPGERKEEPALTALKDMPISFPGLFGDWEFNPDAIAIHIGHGIYWYGIILALGMLAGLLLCMKQAKRFGLSDDNVLDMVLWAVPCCILGSRIYYVIFYLDLFRNADGSLNWGKAVAIWDGGLAIYGTVIAGFLVALIYTRVKKLKLGAMTDLCVMGLLLGQCIGRWANFINREAFGGLTDLPWRMRLWTSAYNYIEVHPTFFYESLWNLIGLLLMLFVVTRGRRFDGENTWFYFLWYGLGRSWVEGLRTDSLYLFDWTFMGAPIRVSQALSMVMVAVSAAMLFYNIKIKKHTSEDLLVNQTAAVETAAAADSAQIASAGEEPAGGPAGDEGTDASEEDALNQEPTEEEKSDGDTH